MKQLILLLLIALIAIVAHSQNDNRNFALVFSAGIDPKMAVEGPHKGAEGNAPSLDAEFSFGLEWSKARLLTQFKTHKAIHFTKWTYLQLDYKQALIKNVFFYGGLEVSQIKTKHPDASYDQPDNYRDLTINPFQLGANLELQYKFFKERAGLAIQFGMYQSEDALKPYKKFRKDITGTLFIYL